MNIIISSCTRSGLKVLSLKYSKITKCMPKIHALKPQLWAMGNYINKKTHVSGI